MARIARGSVAGWMIDESSGWPPTSDEPSNRRVLAKGRKDVMACPSTSQGGGLAAQTALGPRWSSVVGDTTSPTANPPHRRAAAVAVPGRRLGPYLLIERVGRGRQADVWRASRYGTVEEVALKVLPVSATILDPRRLAQLRREAERGARLVSPALLPTFDFGEVDGMVFLAMPLVVGCSLGAVLDHRRDVLAGEPVPVGSHVLASAPGPAYDRTVTGLLVCVARAVAAAHAARVVHRDIKPMNILVRNELKLDDGTIGRPFAPGLDGSCVFLCDFGLARDLDVATPVQLRDGAGSPLYMAPERLRKQQADEVRCDVYAMGVTLFEALTLAPPVEVPLDLPRTHWSEFLATSEPRQARELRPELPADIEQVIQRAMARDPRRRHNSAGHFADDLEHVLVHQA